MLLLQDGKTASRAQRKATRDGQVELVAKAERIERQEIALALSKITECRRES